MSRLTYPPLELIKEITDIVPEIWTMLDEAHSKNGTLEIPKWDDCCYVPMIIPEAIMLATYEVNDHELTDLANDKTVTAIAKAQVAAALAPWRHSKEVFVLSEEMQDLLCEQTDTDAEIPIEILTKLPYQCFYVELAKPIVPGIHGFFVHNEHDPDIDTYELRILVVYNNLDTLGIPITLEQGKTLSQVMHELIGRTENYRRKNGNIPEIAKELVDVDYINLYKCLVQITLYICASNADVLPSAEQKNITKIRKKGTPVKDKYSEVRKWDTGFRVAQKVRRRYNNSNSGSTGTGSAKRPHFRRGHWHHYWTGAKNTTHRKLTLKWVAPTFVNKLDDDMPVTLHVVKKDPHS